MPLLTLIVLTFTLFIDHSVSAQHPKGKLEILQDSRIPALVSKNVQFNSRQKGVMDGYRIQIFFDSGTDSKKRAMDARTDFQAKHPEISAYLSFQEPFYKIRVGDFRFRIEADGCLEKIKSEYPNGFTVKDRINFPRMD